LIHTKRLIRITQRVFMHQRLFKANLTDPSPRDQQDLMAIPFFSLEKSKRTRPIIYEQGDVKVIVRGLADIGIATI
jgi:plasmid replication initiation protein